MEKPIRPTAMGIPTSKNQSCIIMGTVKPSLGQYEAYNIGEDLVLPPPKDIIGEFREGRTTVRTPQLLSQYFRRTSAIVG